MRRFSPSKKLHYSRGQRLRGREEEAARTEKLRSGCRSDRSERGRRGSVTRVISVSSLLESRIETAFHINTKDHEVRTFEHHLLFSKAKIEMWPRKFSRPWRPPLFTFLLPILVMIVEQFSISFGGNQVNEYLLWNMNTIISYSRVCISITSYFHECIQTK